MIKAAVFTVVSALNVFAQIVSFEMAPAGFDAASLPHIRLLDAKSVRFERPGGEKFTEISGLAYDAQQQRLYALSDRGVLHTLDLRLAGGKIQSLELRESHRLADASGKPYQKSQRDAEGMVLTKEGLLVSFEREPRILLFDKNGHKIDGVTIDRDLSDIANYRSSNKALESVAYHPRYGTVTAPESPLRQNPQNEHILYGETRRWRFKAHALVTALEAMPNGNVLVLERGFDGLTRRQIIVLQEVRIEECGNGVCPSAVLARFDSDEGWKLDNFEGLTRIRDNLYLMISDDNDSIFQETVLVLFEVVSP